MLAVNIEKETIKNKNYRKIIYTDKYQQIVLMSLNHGEYIHNEKHKATQFFRIESGNGYAEIKVSGNTKLSDNISSIKKIILKDGMSLSVPPNTFHKIVNTDTKPLKLYTIYSPPVHDITDFDKRQPVE